MTAPADIAALASAKPLVCAVCGHESLFLADHLLEEHGLSVADYLAAHPGSPVVHSLLEKTWSKGNEQVQRKPAPKPEELTITIGKVTFPVNWDVPGNACLPEPPHYREPTSGQLAVDISHAATSIRMGRHTYIWGLPGSGKDAFVHALSRYARLPAREFQVKPDADIQGWFYSQAFDQNGTYWEEGTLFQALRDGYTSPVSGRRMPYLILISDFDRADRSQAEYIRMITDSIQGRVEGPKGKIYPTFPGTIVVATANTMGAGDSRGRCISANPMDASILNRFERKFKFAMMEWKDEEPICRAKFPSLVEHCPEVFAPVGEAVKSLRAAVDDNRLFAEVSHRDVCGWLGHAQDIVEVAGGKVPNNLLKKSAKSLLDGMPDEVSREKAKKLIDPHLKGGLLNPGSTSHIKPGKNLADGWD